MKTTLPPLFALCVFTVPALAQKDVEAILSTARTLRNRNNFAAAAAEMNKGQAVSQNVRFDFTILSEAPGFMNRRLACQLKTHEYRGAELNSID